MPETTSVDDVQIAVYRGSRVIEIVLDRKTVCYSPQIRPEMLETASFDDIAKIVYRMWQSVEIVPGPQNSVLWPTNMARSTRNEVL